MTFSARARYLIITAAILTASAIQIIRGYKLLVVAVGALTFLLVGYAMVYFSGSKQRALRRQQKRDYYAGNS
jgi:uncharacterized protein (DUF58 family)